MNDIVTKAQKWAHDAHDSIGQMRKYGGRVYWVHTDAVSDLLRQAGEDENIQAAAHLHDVLEDVAPTNPTYSLSEMIKEFGPHITQLVVEVTNVFTKENYPELNRTKRKKLEHERLMKISDGAKSIKLADIIDNIGGLFDHNPDFAKVYVPEKSLILPHLKSGNKVLYEKAFKVLANETEKLNQRK